MNYRVVCCGEDICHHGIKGQRWGVRRYQNEDGTLTRAGLKRYYKGEEKARAKLESKLAKSKAQYDAAESIARAKFNSEKVISEKQYQDQLDKIASQEVVRKTLEQLLESKKLQEANSIKAANLTVQEEAVLKVVCDYGKSKTNQVLASAGNQSMSQISSSDKFKSGLKKAGIGVGIGAGVAVGGVLARLIYELFFWERPAPVIDVITKFAY